MGNAVTMQASTSPRLRGGQRDGAQTPHPLTAREERDTRDALDAPSPPSQPLVRHTPTPQPPTTRPPRQDTTAHDDDNNNKEDDAVAATRNPRLQMLERVAHEEHACGDTASKATTSAAAAAVEACERATSPRCRTPPPPRHAVGAAAVADAMAAYRGACTRSASPAAALGAYTALPLSVVRATLQRSHAVYRVCLTGGPCAGKSTMLAYVQTQLPRRTGCRVLCVPEAATMLVTAGMQWDAALRIEQQATVLRTQLALEDTLYALACATAVPTVVLSDRGTMDGRAFCSDDEFAEVLRRVGCSADVLRDRYDAVVHLITAACGAEAYYTLDNNGARYEDVDGARASDAKLRQVYVGHPNLHLIDNATSFAAKMERGLRVILRLLQKDDVDNNNDNNSDDDDDGESGSSSREQQNNRDKDDTSRVKNTDDDADGAASTTWQRTCSYYLVRHCPDVLPTTSAAYDVTTTILCNSQLDDVRLLVRRTTDTGSAMHFFVSVRQAATATVDAAAAAAAAATSATQQRVERVQRISSKEYASLLRHRDMACADVVVRARHFLYEHASCELSTFVAPPWVRGKQTLLIEYETARGDASSNSNNDDNKDNDNNDNDKDNAAAAALTAATSSSSCAVPLPDYVVVDREVPLERTTATFLIAHTQTGPLYTSLVFAPVFSRGVRRRTGSGGGGGGGPHVDVEDVASSTCSMSRQPSSLLQQQQQQLLMLGASRDVVSATTATATATTTRPRTPPTRRDAADKVNGSHADTSSATVMTPLRVRDVNTTATRAKTKHDDEAAVAEQKQQQHGSSTHSDVPVLPRIVPPTTTATVVAAVDADTAASRQRERRHRRTRHHTDKAPAAQTTMTPPRPPPLPLPSSSSRPLSPPPRERVAAASLHLHEDKENVPTTA